MKSNKGITLIALVVTIIVLLILAAVSIIMLTGNNSILRRAKSSIAYNNIGAAKDEVSLAYNAAFSKYLATKYETGTGTATADLGKIFASELKKNVTGTSHNCTVKVNGGTAVSAIVDDTTAVSSVELSYTTDDGSTYTVSSTVTTTPGAENFTWNNIVETQS